MGKYNCEKCGKEFNQKSHYTTHINKKNPCVVESKIKEMINNAVKEKLIEIKKTSSSDIINNIEIVYDNKLVKDVRTLAQSSDPNVVLDGDIEDFCLEYLRQIAAGQFKGKGGANDDLD